MVWVLQNDVVIMIHQRLLLSLRFFFVFHLSPPQRMICGGNFAIDSSFEAHQVYSLVYYFFFLWSNDVDA